MRGKSVGLLLSDFFFHLQIVLLDTIAIAVAQFLWKPESWNFGSRMLLGQLDALYAQNFVIWHPKGYSPYKLRLRKVKTWVLLSKFPPRTNLTALLVKNLEFRGDILRVGEKGAVWNVGQSETPILFFDETNFKLVFTTECFTLPRVSYSPFLSYLTYQTNSN
jgi:hypothetical protein